MNILISNGSRLKIAVQELAMKELQIIKFHCLSYVIQLIIFQNFHFTFGVCSHWSRQLFFSVFKLFLDFKMYSLQQIKWFKICLSHIVLVVVLSFLENLNLSIFMYMFTSSSQLLILLFEVPVDFHL